MNFIAIILLILIWSQTNVSLHHKVETLTQSWFKAIESACNGGQYVHGVLAWFVAVLLPFLLALFLFRLVNAVHPIFGLIFTVLLLWLLLEIKSMMQQAESMANALVSNDIVSARGIFSHWFFQDPSDVKRYSLFFVAKRSIELGVLMIHRRLFAPLFWFVSLGLLGFGPAPVLLYYLSDFAVRQWRTQGVFGTFAQACFDKLNALPSIATAFGLAMVGDFEDALFSWRTQSEIWNDKNDSILLSSCAGALGIKLGDGFPQGGVMIQRPELGVGEEPEGAHLLSAIGLMRRVFVLWVVILFMLSVAYWLGT